MPVKVMFIEDDTILGKLISLALKKEGFEVTFLETLDSVRETIASVTPDILVLDLEVGQRCSLDELPFIHSAFPSLPVVVASSHTDGEEVTMCYERGANCYIKKPYDIKELAFHIRRLLADGTTASPEEYSIGNYKVEALSQKLFYKEELFKMLNRKECSLLCMLAEKKGTVVLRKDILEKVWGEESKEESLNNNIACLRKYLEKDPAVIIQTIKGKGYNLIDTSE